MSVVEAVYQQDSKTVEGSSLQNASDHETQVLFDANHVEAEEVCVNDQAVKEGWHSGRG